ncbi:cyclase family protein [Arthrobacter sp. KNU40]|uniref:cyclase family protein n=1 Tax=Arthrobacter sp. KNU40 TaxID=3447965 RepID=UPI003F63BB66
MTFIEDPYTGLKLLELSHPWGHGAPSYPGQRDVSMFRAVKHAEHGVLSWRINMSMHSGTHMNAPIHLIQGGADMSQLQPHHFFGNGVVLDIPKSSYETITSDDLVAAGSKIRENDVVVIVTGWHRRYSDALEYFGESPGLTKDAAQWLVSKKVKLVAVDTPQIDHPLATSLGPHRGGPTMKRLAEAYQKATGLDPKEEHPEWNVAHKTLLAAGIPTIEQTGGDVDELAGRRATFAATPWKLTKGDACPVRFIAMIDPKGTTRINPGNN